MSNRCLDGDTIWTVYPLVRQFVCVLYGAEGKYDVDDARLDLLLHGGRDFENIPPLSDALYQHVLRSVYQSGYIWGCMFDTISEEVDTENFGRNKVGGVDSSLVPVYTTHQSYLGI